MCDYVALNFKVKSEIFLQIQETDTRVLVGDSSDDEIIYQSNNHIDDGVRIVEASSDEDEPAATIKSVDVSEEARDLVPQAQGMERLRDDEAKPSVSTFSIENNH